MASSFPLKSALSLALINLKPVGRSDIHHLEVAPIRQITGLPNTKNFSFSKKNVRNVSPFFHILHCEKICFFSHFYATWRAIKSRRDSHDDDSLCFALLCMKKKQLDTKKLGHKSRNDGRERKKERKKRRSSGKK